MAEIERFQMAAKVNRKELRARVAEEITLIPEERLRDLYDFIRFFRIGLEVSKNIPKKNAIRFARIWQDMTDREFNEFSEEIAERRRDAFSGRKGRESLTD